MSKKFPKPFRIDLFSSWIFLARTQAELDAVFKKFGKKLEKMPLGGAVWGLKNTENGSFSCILAANVEHDDSDVCLAGLLAHEAVHCAQNILEDICEASAVIETPAYLTQKIVYWAFPLCLEKRDELRGLLSASAESEA